MVANFMEPTFIRTLIRKCIWHWRNYDFRETVKEQKEKENLTGRILSFEAIWPCCKEHKFPYVTLRNIQGS